MHIVTNHNGENVSNSQYLVINSDVYLNFTEFNERAAQNVE